VKKVLIAVILLLFCDTPARADVGPGPELLVAGAGLCVVGVLIAVGLIFGGFWLVRKRSEKDNGTR
jgi:hypothetical protein